MYHTHRSAPILSSNPPTLHPPCPQTPPPMPRSYPSAVEVLHSRSFSASAPASHCSTQVARPKRPIRMTHSPCPHLPLPQHFLQLSSPSQLPHHPPSHKGKQIHISDNPNAHTGYLAHCPLPGMSAIPSTSPIRGRLLSFSTVQVR